MTDDMHSCEYGLLDLILSESIRRCSSVSKSPRDVYDRFQFVVLFELFLKMFPGSLDAQDSFGSCRFTLLPIVIHDLEQCVSMWAGKGQKKMRPYTNRDNGCCWC